MKLTSGDSSFDLLNDNISFLANESSQHMDQDSFLMSPVQLTQKSPPPLAPSYSEPDATAPGVVAQTSSHSGSIDPTSVPPLHVVKRVQPPRLAQSSAKASKQGSDSRPHQRVRSSKLKSKGTSQPAFTCDENASAPASVLARALKVSKQNGVSAVLRHEDENICVGTKRSFAEFNAKNTSVDGPRRVPVAKKQMTMAPGDERHCLANSQTAIVKHKPTGLRIPNQNRLGERRLKPTSSASSRLPGPVKIAGLRGIGGLARPPPPHFSKP
ncbi:hypothetical protein DL96DRAFT_88356 [Flagelloscypha sp. PMI_526]|nr:hypothetical protein DL96DRAFT_88356 [Flagelloscypha sp. PMI_526]